MKTSTQLLEIFGGNPYHAVGRLRAKKGGSWYEPVDEPLSESLLESHLSGEAVLGSYPVQQDNTVKWLGWDIDDAEDLKRARDVAERILSRVSHLPVAVEFSGGKGYHIFLFLDEPMPASKAKEISDAVRKIENLPRTGNPHVECYPKQAQIAPAQNGERRRLGNLIKIPLGTHLLTHSRSRFVDPTNGWEDGPELAAEEVLGFRVSHSEVENLLEQGPNLIQELAQSLSVDWDAGKRHDISLYLAGYLFQIGWTFDQAQKLIEHICDLRGDEDRENRIQSLRDTYRKASRGGSVAGFQKLSEVLSGATMSLVARIAPNVASPDIANRVDQIRWDKGPGWDKERRAANLIWSHLTDRERGGRILRVATADLQDHQTYWFSVQDKQVVPLSSRQFEVVLYRTFHLNTAEPFARRVQEQILLKAESQGDLVTLHKGSIWIDGKLYVSLGGAEIYVLDGLSAPTTVTNGEGDLFFTTRGTNIPEPDFDDPMDVWETLINDLNFSQSAAAPIPPAYQAELLKAWILAMFFRSILPTRPILTMLGAPGSGKTTAVRRLLRLIEGLDQDVLEVPEDKPDFWRAALEEQSFIVLDNLEEIRAQWLQRSLDQVATGSMIKIRRLYSTNRTYTIQGDAFVAITAVNMPFSKSTLFERLLVLNMEKLNTYIPSHTFDQTLQSNISRLWADLILKLNRVVHHMNTTPPAHLAINVRMSDFALFCARLEECNVLEGGLLKKALTYLGSAQQVALSESEHSVYPLLRDWVERNPEQASQQLTAANLFEVLSKMARATQRNFRWKNSTALTHHLKAMDSVLRQQLGMVIETVYDSSKGRNRLMYSFPGASLLVPVEEEAVEVPSDA